MRAVDLILGVAVEITPISNPLVIATADGEICAEPGGYLVERPGAWPEAIDASTFAACYQPESP